MLGKPKCKLVLKIIDIQNHIADEIAEDGFLFGFKLATELAFELKRYDGHLCGDDAGKDVRRSILSEKGE